MSKYDKMTREELLGRVSGYMKRGTDNLSPHENEDLRRCDVELRSRSGAYDDDLAERGANRTAGPRAWERDREVRGREGELLDSGMSMRTWYNRAVENKVMDSRGTDIDFNSYWGGRVSAALKGAGYGGFAKPSVESRTLLEDTAGSAQAISPEAWSADVVDILLPNSIMGKTGVHRVGMPHETVNVPVFSSTVSPNYIAEAGAISIDGGPAFGTMELTAPGAIKVITSVSIEAMQDAYIEGNLNDYLANAIARKVSVVIDTTMFQGIAGNVGVPGLINESGFVVRKQTGDTGTTGFAPVDTSELAVIRELAMKKNADVTAYVSNVGVQQAFERIPVTAYGRYWENPSLADDVNWVTSENSALGYAETDPAAGTKPALTGGTYSSLYAGDFAKWCYFGVRLDLSTRLLTERYIDNGLVGIFAAVRYSIRFAHPETFSQTYGIVTR